MSYNQYPLELVTGSTFSASITLLDKGVPVNLTGLMIRSQIRDIFENLIGEFLITIADQGTAPGVVRLAASPTTGIIAPGKYRIGKGRLWYDILLVSPGGSKVAYYASELYLIQGVTRV